MKPSSDSVRSEVDVGKGKNVISLLAPAAGHQTPPFVSLQVEAGDLYGHAEHGRSNGDGHLVLEDLEEWSWHGLTDIHHKAPGAGEDAHHGDHGAEQAP